MKRTLLLALCLVVLQGAILPAFAQPPAPGSAPAVPAPRPQQPPAVISPEVSADRHITFRLLAPRAEEVRLNGGDIQGLDGQPQMKKNDRGVWEVTVGPVAPGAYRYQFNVGGVTTLDPRNPVSSESLGSGWSMVVVPGSDWMDTKNVPHGAVGSITYYSTALSRFRRMHIYTPPGYEKGNESYPVFYLLHGAGDSDDAWTSVGRANFILDNLIAAGKAKPMIVVMPAGHTRAPGAPGGQGATAEFVSDFTQDIMPYVESHYRTKNTPESRAIAGLSMGGAQTLNVLIGKLDQFSYVGVYSSGLIGIVPIQRAGGPPPAPVPNPYPWEEQNRARLDDANLRKGLRVFWFATGKDDFLLPTTRATLDLFKKHGFTVEFKETEGGHTWLNWRDYLIEFVPRLFQ